MRRRRFPAVTPGGVIEPPGFCYLKNLFSAFFRFWIVLSKGFYCHFFHDYRCQRGIAPVCAAGSELIDDIHSFCDLAKSRIGTVQVRGVLVHNEELGAGGIRILCPGHGDHSGTVLKGVVKSIGRELAGDAVVRAAGTVA